MINNFDAGYKLLNDKVLTEKYPTFRQKMDLFFIDYDFVPLIVQDSYLNAMGDRNDIRSLEAMAEASDFISQGDQISKQIRTNQEWSLLPNMGFASSVAPAMLVKGYLHFPRFPEWLGKNSSQRKSKRLLKEVKQAMAHRAMADKIAI